MEREAAWKSPTLLCPIPLWLPIKLFVGCLDHFLSFEPHALQQNGQTDVTQRLPISAAQWLHHQREHRAEEARTERTALDQLVLASEQTPRRFRTRWQAISFQGPTARQDVETAERNKWLDVLADIQLALPTPLGALLREDPASRRMLRAGRRVGAVRARVRSIRKCLAWLAAAHELPFATTDMHLVEFLQVQHSEPSPRGAIKLTHAGFVFMEELSGVKEKLTAVTSVKQELMATSLGARESKQAPRFPEVILAALEEPLADDAQPVFHRIMAW